MTVDERSRRLLHDRLDEVLGHDAADVLIRELATMRDDQLATKRDLERGLAGLGSELRGEIAELRSDIVALRHEMREGDATLRADLMEHLVLLGDRQTTQFRQLLYAQLASVFTVAALAFGAASLG